MAHFSKDDLRTQVERLLALPNTFLVLASLFVVAAAGLVLTPKLGWPRVGMMKIISDVGSMAAGLLAVAAGLLTVYATLRTINLQREIARKAAAATAVAQLKGVWSYIEARGIVATLATAVANLDQQATAYQPNTFGPPEGVQMRSYRGHLGPNWLTLITTSPQSFGALPIGVAEASIGYFAELLNVIGRLNWLNDHSFSFPKDRWVIEIHRDASKDIGDLKHRYSDLLLELERVL